VVFDDVLGGPIRCRVAVACWGPAMDRLGIVGILMVAACIGSCTRMWVRPGADAADLAREKFECQFEASKAVASSGTDAGVAESRRVEFESLCMEAKGWSRSRPR
jgi:hypothetical protein